MRAVVLLSLLAVAIATPLLEVARTRGADPTWSQFVTFTEKYGRKYQSVDEVNARFSAFQGNLERNIELSKLNPYAAFGVNKFSDISAKDFAAMYLMPVNITSQFNKYRDTYPKYTPQPVSSDATGDIDWCSAGYCSPVKNQEQCGSCWAFSATETLESATYQASKKNGYHVPRTNC